MQTRKREKVLLECNQQDTKIPINTYSKEKTTPPHGAASKIKPQLVAHTVWSEDAFQFSINIEAWRITREGEEESVCYQ